MTEQELTKGAEEAVWAHQLRQRGWTCIAPAGFEDGLGERPSAFCRRLGIHPHTLCRAWDSTAAPKIKIEMGPTGARVMRLWPTPEFEAWLRRNKRVEQEQTEQR